MEVGRQMKGVLYAASAGICGSTAGMFGKIGMSVNEFLAIATDQVTYTILARVIMLTMVVLANVGVWLMYTRALRYGSTLAATGISVSTNYICTAVTGVVLFAESYSVLWVCGTLSVIVGAVLMSIECLANQKNH